MSKLHPFRISKTPDGVFQMVGDDFGVYEEKFAAFGREGGGYDWEEMAVQIIADQAPKLEGKITFDSEASLFVAMSEQRKPLEALAKLLQGTFSDKRRLKRVIRLANEAEAEPEASSLPYVVIIHFGEYMFDEYDNLKQLLLETLEPPHSFESGAILGGQSNLFFRTEDPDDFLRRAKPILKETRLLERALIGFRTDDEDQYSVLLPRTRKSKFSPIMDL